MTAMLDIESSHDALAQTIGPLADHPAAGALQDADRVLIEGWRDRRWAALEERAGALAPRDPAAWYELLVTESWRAGTDNGQLPSHALALFYKAKPLIPRSVQLAMRRRLIKRQGEPDFPRWPFESAGSDLLRIAIADELLARGTDAVRFRWFWPEGAAAAVTLTHDVESAAGLARAPEVASWEERRGLRSSFNVVSEWYPVDMRTVAELAERGHEIGSHALYHDRSLFASRESFEQQLPLLRQAAERLGAVGFRSPATHRVIEWLKELPFSYDCTMSHSDPFEPIPGGTATVWPFFFGDVLELPYTAPQDHTLFNLLGQRDSAIWRGQLERIVECNGMFQAITHPDDEYLGSSRIATAYGELLDAIAVREDVWVALPREIDEWWRRRVTDPAPPDDGAARWTGSEIELVPEGAHDAR